MSVPMKKPLTEIQVKVGQKSFHYTNIPQSKLKPILTLLKNYQDDSIPWRELAKDRIQTSGGEPAYMLKTSRKAVNMTQAQLAAQLNMPQGNLSQIESGKRAIGKSLAKKLGNVFDLDYRVFL